MPPAPLTGSPIGRAEKHLARWMTILIFPLMVTEHLFHYPVIILGVMGAIHWLRLSLRQKYIAKPGADMAWVLLLFACVFMPMLLSMSDAFEPEHTKKTVLSYLHFLPAALYVCFICRDPETRLTILNVSSLLVGLLVVDALIQITVGVNLLGFERDSAVLTGMFDTNQRLGLVLALFLPLVLYCLQYRVSWGYWKWTLLIPYSIVILFSLKRSAWVMLALGATAYFVIFLYRSQLGWKVKLLIPVSIVAVVMMTGYFVPSVGSTLKTTIGALNADYETLDIATSRRLTLWRTGANIVRAHPINGIGPRGYRHAYRSFAEEGDFWIAQGSKGQTHPHLMGLEVLVETGLLGLVGLIIFMGLLLRNIFLKREDDPAGAMWLILGLVAWFPLNTHLAFYGSYWSTFAWLFLAIGAANPNPPSARATALTT
jgi:O-antigen ligase